MFEHVDVDSNASNTHRKTKRLHRLLVSYAEERSKKQRKLNHKSRQALLYNDNGLEDQHQLQDNIGRGSSKKVYPEETFETWYNRTLILPVANLDNGNGQKSINQENEIAEERQLNDDLVDVTSSDAEDESLTVDSIKKSTQSWTTTNVLIQTRGLEVLPTFQASLKSGGNPSRINVMKHNIGNLKTLLHLNVLKRNWDTAYKLFCLLIRIPKVDLRSLWPVGIEILLHKYKQQNGDLRTSLPKHQMFYEWLCSFLVLYNYQPLLSDSLRVPRTISAPAWRSGSKTHTPLYVVGFLWQLLIDKDYDKLKEKVDELLLEPPYNSDGIFYFLKIVLQLYDAVDLINEYKTSGNYKIQSKVLDLVATMEKTADKCAEFDFEIPQEWFRSQTEKLVEHVSDDGFNEITSDSSDTQGDSCSREGSEKESTSGSPSQSEDSDSDRNLEKDYINGSSLRKLQDNSDDDGWGDIISDSDSEDEVERQLMKRTEKEQTPLSEPVNYVIDDGWSDIEDDEEEEEENDPTLRKDAYEISTINKEQPNELEFDFDFE